MFIFPLTEFIKILSPFDLTVFSPTVASIKTFLDVEISTVTSPLPDLISISKIMPIGTSMVTAPVDFSL